MKKEEIAARIARAVAKSEARKRAIFEARAAATEQYAQLVALADELGLDISFAHYRTRHFVVHTTPAGQRCIPHIAICTDRYYRSGAYRARWEPAARGGGTICRLYNPDGIVSAHLEKCSSDDAFVYQKGRANALQHALRAAGL